MLSQVKHYSGQPCCKQAIIKNDVFIREGARFMEHKVIVDVSEVYELLGSFMIYITRKWTDSLDIGSVLITDMDTRLPQGVRADLAKASAWPFLDYDVLYALAMKRNKHNDIPSFIQWIEASSKETLYASVLPFMPALTLSDFERICRDYPPLLTQWYDYYFAGVENELIPLLQEDAQEKSILLQKMEPADLIEYATGGVILDEVHVKTVVLFPGVHFRPINTYCFYEDTLLIQYPVDMPEENEEDPPVVLLRMTEALSDPDRLRILRYLAREPKTIHEMVHSLNQDDDKLLHHLVILRAAGLLRSHVQPGVQTERFSLRPDGASELQMFLESYIRLS